MALEFTRFSRDLSRLELFIAISIIALLIGLGVRQMLLLAAMAEKQFLQATITNINTALHYQAGIYRLKGEYEKLAQMDKMNPLSLALSEQKIEIHSELDAVLAQHARPTVSSFSGRYMGEIDGITDEELEAGNWYFDVSGKILIYTVNNSEYFISELEGIPRIRFRVSLNFIDNNENGIYDPEMDVYTDIKLKQLESSRWEI